MDNPEEVLQALDEFQKMRPSEIPKELEDYLCFVAKTGDPVYQWSLIKPLFREKLVRVMTEFYESCPTLDLASSPNLEHFNYDIMKCNLLELLESFANAPFTVQRICELLTSPRKEYNRVDKFMRAIEKNILVVSTKEPGPAARRSENGDSMVNGTIDDEESTPTQATHEVEMESWVKDCTADANVSTIPVVAEHDVPLMVTAAAAAAAAAAVVMPSTKIIPKDLLADDDNTSSIIQEKNDQQLSTKSSEMTVSNFIAAAHEMSNSTNITSTGTTTHTNNTATTTESSLIYNNNIQNLSTNIVGDSTDTPIGIISDVSDAIINEDTSSQPSLDSESGDDNETHASNATTTTAAVINKKLQTTFQTKDFAKIDDDDTTGDDIAKASNNKYYSESNGSKIEDCKLPLLLSSSSSSSLINNETDINVDGEGRLSPAHQRDETVSNSDDESKSSCDSNSELIEKRPRIDSDNETTALTTISTAIVSTDKIDNNENRFTSVISTKIELNSSKDKSNCDEIGNKCLNSEEISHDKTQNLLGELTERSSQLSSNNILQSDPLFAKSQQQQQQQKHNQELSSDLTIDSESSKDESVTENSQDSTSTSDTSSKPIVEEPPFNNVIANSQRKSESNINTTIVETMDDDIKENHSNTMIPDPIPIIEEPKEDTITMENNVTGISELSVDNFSVSQIEESEMLQQDQEQAAQTSINTVQTMNVLKDSAGVSVAVPITTPTATIVSSNLSHTQEKLTSEIVEKMESKTIDAGESMEVDSDDSMGMYHCINDDYDDDAEPMEQESGELIKS